MSQTAESTRTIDGVELPPAGIYNVDTAHSSVDVVARHLMVTKVRGHFAKFSGTVTIAEVPEESKVSATIETASFTSGQEMRDNHVLSADFLDAEHYPTITFESTRLVRGKGSEFQLEGDLTVHGVTKPITLNCEYTGVTSHPQMGTRVGLSASAEIDRFDFGVAFSAALETGSLIVSRNVRIELEVQLVAAQ
ncbi:MAG TPA: YceI family protein [Actinomycetota bacterium]|nr:YceI family protein [Actinomycetota bacterium]